ncbi:protein CASPARIAN STRIP INTEGRITY FACTOR 1 [Elaeis guineensis]|uniref:Protein CASPARIAN STRIP INTEGRITY FACTOR 1 n=1 Tax=Elaeis guineensis var. tenera TaxID=51953 RepID=A0A6I9R930_ELAGV|nr:protein CASPARIAN STRIP INTEGRITY FACTOR 1 [Elaeis guineensis]
MGLMAIRKATLLFIILVSLASSSLAGRQKILMDESTVQVEDMAKDTPKEAWDSEEALVVHPRILTVKTNDYGRYDPAPALRKPPFKLIPN